MIRGQALLKSDVRRKDIADPGDDGQRYRVAVADDNERMRHEVVSLLSRDYELVGVFANCRALVNAVLYVKPDVVVLDICVPGLNGFEAVRRMRTDGVEARVIFFTTIGNPAYVRQAMSLGVTGYVLKAFGYEELPVALKAVLRGQTFVSPSIGMAR